MWRHFSFLNCREYMSCFADACKMMAFQHTRLKPTYTDNLAASRKKDCLEILRGNVNGMRGP